MFIITHSIIGALIGEKLNNHPVIAFVLAFIAHFFTDLIPHGDTNLYKGYVAGTKVKKALLFIAADVVATTLFVLYLFTRVIIDHRIAIIMGVLGGILPDLLVALYEISHTKWLKWFYKLHFYFHDFISSRIGDLSLPTGTIMEVIILIILLVHVVW